MCVCAHRKSPWKNFKPFTADWIVVSVASGTHTHIQRLLIGYGNRLGPGTTALLSFQKWHCKLYFQWHSHTHTHTHIERYVSLFILNFFFVYPFVYLDFSIWKWLKWFFFLIYLHLLTQSVVRARAYRL